MTIKPKTKTKTKKQKKTEDQLYRVLAYVLQREIQSMSKDATENEQYFLGGALRGICIGFTAASSELDCPEGVAAALKHAMQIAAIANFEAPKGVAN